ncbi:glycosyltransferase family 2 protein [Candidatus Rhodoblastus alkanivorans]|uniref:Glycosyltransferase n=1 Tax=Candidatus Rhodoblastus alkanivorans TaxID=2954117 RepID=A0ABS9Z3X1_9HYPH|nr:glycosyltransferase [Candidatus Rhodoblastus alkanivorans]MCI4681337.1 glycosyltransferase [Candidatus Rhodoblastus alkanivorans]
MLEPPARAESKAGLRLEKLLDADALFFDSKRHFEALLLEIGKNIEAERPDLAFPFADRRCRLLKPSARDFLLRSEISRRAGFLAEGAGDLEKAIALDPTDRRILQFALTWGEAAQKSVAARLVLSEDDPDPALVGAAADWLMKEDEAPLFVVSRRDGLIKGWAAWMGAAEFHLRFEGQSESIVALTPEPDHWLADETRFAASIRLEAAEDWEIATLLRDGRRVATRRLKAGGRAFADAAPPPAALSVIVPVYEDFAATRACFEALFAQGAPPAARIFAVDDASPNAALRAWLDDQAAAGRLVLLRNDDNLGFAASVNRALALCPQGDVVLLNADASPPPESLARLAEVARAAPDIDTVTPLSNNGEYVSLPKPNAVNAMESPAEIARIDRLAREANGLDFVDLPNGIGFCLYITRACLDAVGPLPEVYARGYYEDVEFCLRAREKGFRNVCAAGVYVGHEGTRSFRAEKRRLVMRNLAVLERRFPYYQIESASFVEADPLRRARGAIEALLPNGAGRVALVCAGGAARLLARERAEALAAEAAPAPLICACAGDRAELRGASGAWPQSLGFALDDRAGLDGLMNFLRAEKIARIELFDPLALSPRLLAALFRLGARVEIAAGDLEWALPLRTPFGGACRTPDASGPCSSCAEGAYAVGAEEEARRRRVKRKRAILARAEAIRPLDRMSDQIARHIFSDAAVVPIAEPPIATRPLDRPPAGALAVLMPLRDPLADRLVIALGRALRRRDETARIVVFGACVDDLAVMKPGNVFVAGAVERGEYERLLRQYEASALMSPYRTRLFGRTDVLSRAFALPKACFDFSFGKLAREDGDLALDPRLCDAKAAALAAQWFSAPSQRAASC